MKNLSFALFLFFVSIVGLTPFFSTQAHALGTERELLDTLEYCTNHNQVYYNINTDSPYKNYPINVEPAEYSSMKKVPSCVQSCSIQYVNNFSQCATDSSPDHCKEMAKENFEDCLNVNLSDSWESFGNIDDNEDWQTTDRIPSKPSHGSNSQHE